MSNRRCRACKRPDGPVPPLVYMSPSRLFGTAAMTGNLLASECGPVIPMLSPAMPRMVPPARYWITDDLCSECLHHAAIIPPTGEQLAAVGA